MRAAHSRESAAENFNGEREQPVKKFKLEFCEIDKRVRAEFQDVPWSEVF